MIDTSLPDGSRSFREPKYTRTKEKCRMKKNTARIMYLLGIVMAVMALSSLLGVTTSAGNYTITRYVGIRYSLPKVTAENDYGPPFNSYSFSDLSMVLIDGKTITKNSSIR